MALISPRQILKEQYNQRGQIIIDDARLLGSLLRDLCGATVREIAALQNAQNALVPSALKISTGIPHPLLINKITRQLQSHENMEDLAARWAVETWAYALGIIDSSECTTPETFSPSVNPPPTPQPGSPKVIRRYENWKHDLFDFSRRNPLLYYKPTQSSSLEIVQPEIYSLFDRLIIKRKPLSFPQYRVESFLPEPGAPLGTRSRHRYILEKKGEIECDKQAGYLVRALGNIRNLARASRTELGLNSLYLSFGMLRWNEYKSSVDNYAPLILVPTELVIKESRDGFYLSFFDDDIVLNPTLSAFLNDSQYGYYFKLPDFHDDLRVSLQTYLDNVNKLVAARMWHVEPKAVLRLFSFQTIRMGEDMDQADEINLYPPVIKLLSHEPVEPLPTKTQQEYSDLDDQLRPEDFSQVLEADASQVAALALARSGDTMVLHGPPGTGKSQTIVNLIAQAVADKKSVLFVSQKKAALDVVYRRLTQLGLDKFCLQVHSDKANKRAVLNELQLVCQNSNSIATAVTPQTQEFSTLYDQRKRLNLVANELNTPLGALSWTIQQIQGYLFELRDIPASNRFIHIKKSILDIDPVQWQAIQDVSQEYVAAYQLLGYDPGVHPWRHLAKNVSPAIKADLQSHLNRFLGSVDKATIFCRGFSKLFIFPEGNTPGHLHRIIKLTKILQEAPPLILAWFEESQQPVIQATFNEGKRLVTASTNGREKLHQESISEAIFKLNHLAETSFIQQNLVILNFFFSKPYEAADGPHRKELESIIGEALAAASEAVQLHKQATRTFGYDFPETSGKLRWMGKLARVCAAEPHPLPNWFDPAGMAKTRACLQEAMKASASHAKSVARIQMCWDVEVIAIGVDEINQNLEENTQARIKRLISGEYKAWQKGILQFWRAPRNASHEDLLILLQDLKAIQKCEGWFAKNNTVISDLLGPRFSGLHSDFAGISKALNQTQQIINLFNPEPVPAEVKKILCEGSVGSAAWILLSDQLEQVSARLPKALENCANEFNREFLNRVGNGDALNLETAYELLLDVNQKLLGLNGKFDNLAAVFQGGAPGFGKLLEVLKIADEVVKAEGHFYAKSDLFRQYFGSYYAGLKTDWARLSQSLKVANEIFGLLNEAEKISTHYSSASPNILPYAKKICLKQDLQKDARAILKVGISIKKQLDQQLEDLLSYFTGLDEEFDHTALDDVLFSFLQEWAKNLLETIDSIPTWQRFADANQGIIQQGLKDFPLENHKSEKSKLNLLPDIIRKRIYQLWLLEAYNRLPAAGNLKISQHRQTIQSFRELDQRLIAEQKLRVLTAWQNNLPAITQSVPVSQVEILSKEFQKKKSHLPLRRLFGKIPDLLLKLKPCLLMSPLSVAAYLDLEQFKERFDIIIFDEASQVKPAYAIGAILRGKQVIVAGDTQQLSPTDFFRATGDLEELPEDDAMEEEDVAPESLESILGEFIGLPGVRQTYLLRHYRSLHESLIQFSNRSYYNHNLITFPDPSADTSDRAIQFNCVQGVYDRGKSRQNGVEAQKVVQLIEQHLKKHGNKLSLGVITFSIAQENAIREELKHEVEKPDSFLKPFLEFLDEDSSSDEPFFIKSLERVQGDERDSIIISIGYGPDAKGKISQNFGPINIDGGERRLNVAITRSRRELFLVVSLTSEDIRITGKSKPGLRDLKRFLEYCQGMGEIYNKGFESNRVTTPFESSVKKTIEDMGFVVDENVGFGNCQIDLGVRNPEKPDEYIVAIICDGSTYASAKIARDRDWLGEQILQKMGWKKVIHLWSKEWMDQPDQAVQNLKKELEEMCGGRNLVENSPKDMDNKPKIETKVGEQSIKQTQIPGPVELESKLQLQEYIFYSPVLKNGLSESLSGADFIEEIVRIEQPIHQDLLHERWETYSDSGGLSKNKRRILFSQSLNQAIQSKMVVLRDDFIELPERKEEIIPRIPPVGQSPRNIEQIALIEIAALSRQILSHVHGINRKALVRKTCQILGFQAFTEYRHARIDAAVDWMVDQGMATLNGDSVLSYASLLKD